MLACGLAACGTKTRCLLPSQQPAVSATFYLGRAIPGRPPLREDEWERFLRAELAPRFGDGFTVFDANGSWRDTHTGLVGEEATKIVQVVAPQSSILERDTLAVAEAYRRQFHQAAVGIVTSPVCASFQ